MKQWEDISSYSRDDKERIPQSWEVRCGFVRIVVTRLHGCDGWHLRAHGVVEKRLESESIEDAKSEAIVIVTSYLTEALAEVEAL